MKTLTILCFDQYSKMLVALNSLQDASQVVELGTTHSNQHVILYLGEVSADILSQAADSGVIVSPHADLLPAYFKQKSVRVEKNVVCVESVKLSTIFSVANMALAKGFQCVEINRSMNESGLAVAIFANGMETSIFNTIKDIQFVKLETPSSTLKKFF